MNCLCRPLTFTVRTPEPKGDLPQPGEGLESWRGARTVPGVAEGRAWAREVERVRRLVRRWVRATIVAGWALCSGAE